jgi:type I restriction enzyme S subunit
MSFEFSTLYRFADLLSEPLRNGIYKTKEHHGRGVKVVNMGELFGHPRLRDVPMKRLELTEGELRKSSLREGDLLFARRSLVAAGAGKCTIVKEIAEPTTFESSIIRARPNESLADSDYLYYFFSSPQGRELMGTILRQVAVSGITGGDLAELKIPLPNLNEQHKQASVLQALDDRITLLRETNTTLEAIAQSLFKSWFVDFDPVHAKMQGRAPEGMDDATAALFPDSFEESELGAVPKGWQVMPIGDAVETVGGATPDTKTPEYWEPAEHHWTTPKDLSGIASPVLLSTERKLSNAGIKKISSGLLPVGSLLMSSRAPIGYLALAQTPMAINQGYIAMPPGGKLSPLYMLFWCQTNMDNIKGRANGSTFMEISKKAFRPIPALVAPQSILDPFDEVARSLFSLLVENEKQAQTLSALRDTLLPRLISGQLQLPEAVKLEEALE